MTLKVLLCVVACVVVNVGFMEWLKDFIKAKTEKEIPAWILSVLSMFFACFGGFLAWKYVLAGTPFFIVIVSFLNLAVQQLAYQTVVQTVQESFRGVFSKIGNGKN